MDVKSIRLMNMISTYEISMDVTFGHGLLKTFSIQITQRGLEKLAYKDIAIIAWPGAQDDLPLDWRHTVTKSLIEYLDLDYTLEMRHIHTDMLIQTIDATKEVEPTDEDLVDDIEKIIKEANGLDDDGNDDQQYWIENNTSDINSPYEEITKPSEFIKNFKTLAEFKDWCKEGSLMDLFCTLTRFENAEEYLHCAVIRDTITDKKIEELIK